MNKTAIIVMTLILATNVMAEPVEVIPPQNKTLGTASGRFVFGQISSMRRDQYMLDTQTGRLWTIVVDEKEHTKLQPVPYVQIMGDEAYAPDSWKDVTDYQGLVRSSTLKSLKEEINNEKKQK